MHQDIYGVIVEMAQTVRQLGRCRQQLDEMVADIEACPELSPDKSFDDVVKAVRDVCVVSEEASERIVTAAKEGMERIPSDEPPLW